MSGNKAHRTNSVYFVVLWWVCLLSVCVSVFVSVSVYLHNLKTVQLNFTKFFLCVACGHGSVLFWWLCDTLFNSGFMDDIMFYNMGPVGGRAWQQCCWAWPLACHGLLRPAGQLAWRQACWACWGSWGVSTGPDPLVAVPALWRLDSTAAGNGFMLVVSYAPGAKSAIYDCLVFSNAMVISRLEYCNAALAGLLQATVWSLQHVHSSAACLIFELSSWPYVALQLHWLPVHWHIQFSLLHDALCLLRDVLSLSDEHCRAHWCWSYMVRLSFNIVDRIHIATAADTKFVKRAFSYASSSA